jgi:uncharacterized membrane protein
MRSASVGGHPIHPMLVPLPIGLWLFSFLADVLAVSGTQSGPWPAIAFHTMAGGLVGAVLAAVPGLIDFRGIGEKRTRRLATYHLVLNVVLVVLYATNLWLRSTGADGGLTVGMSGLGIVVLGASGWLGGELVFVRRMGMTAANAPTAASRTR